LIYFDENTAPAVLTSFLHEKGWIPATASVRSLQKAGQGNMNVVLRIATENSSFILKQSRPYVQKYQDIKAPLERIAVEQLFYTAMENNGVIGHFPKVLAYDAQNHLLQLEDLGDCDDMVYLYGDQKIAESQTARLVQIAHAIHSCDAPGEYHENLSLRQLNHQHIFVLPFLEENGFSLDSVQPGLQALSLPFKKDAELKKKVQQLGENYLALGTTLIHGDYYPGSWMSQGDTLYVIDPEFSFLGFAEFDLGVMAAHLIMATMQESSLASVLNSYEGTLNDSLVAQIAGTEIIRRIIGLAQLPLKRTLDEKAYLLKEAYQLITKH